MRGNLSADSQDWLQRLLALEQEEGPLTPGLEAMKQRLLRGESSSLGNSNVSRIGSTARSPVPTPSTKKSGPR